MRNTRFSIMIKTARLNEVEGMNKNKTCRTKLQSTEYLKDYVTGLKIYFVRITD